MNTTETYSGQEVLINYLRERRNNSSYRGFLNLYRDVIFTSPPKDNWKRIDDAWAKRFLREAKGSGLDLALNEKVRFVKREQLLITYNADQENYWICTLGIQPKLSIRVF